MRPGGPAAMVLRRSRIAAPVTREPFLPRGTYLQAARREVPRCKALVRRRARRREETPAAGSVSPGSRVSLQPSRQARAAAGRLHNRDLRAPRLTAAAHLLVTATGRATTPHVTTRGHL